MLRPYRPPVISPQDEDVFEALVRRDHWVRRAEKHVDFLKLREVVEGFYTADFGCPGIEPVLLIKVELLLYHDNLSDSQLWQRVESDLAYPLVSRAGESPASTIDGNPHCERRPSDP